MVAAHSAAEACVCDLTEPLGLSQGTVSHHLKRGVAKLLDSLLLPTVVVSSGTAATNLSPADAGLEFLENAIATAFGLFALILMLGRSAARTSTRSPLSSTRREVVLTGSDERAVDTVQQLGYTFAPVVVVGAASWSGFRPDKIKAVASARATELYTVPSDPMDELGASYTKSSPSPWHRRTETARTHPRRNSGTPRPHNQRTRATPTRRPAVSVSAGRLGVSDSFVSPPVARPITRSERNWYSCRFRVVH